MNPVRRRLAAAALVAAALGLAGLVRVAAWRPLPLVGERPAGTRASGVVHVHTTLSDGGGTPDEVIGAARRTGLAFVSISDHNTLDAKPLEGYHDGVLVLVDAELSTPSGHVLGVGLDRDPSFRFNGDARTAFEDVRDLGGVAFAAHPFSAREDLRFSAWDAPGPWGIEVLNGDSEWRRAGPRLLLSTLVYRLNPSYALLAALAPIDEALARWDALLAERDVVGIAGLDAHSRLPITRSVSLRFPSYESLFRLARLHVGLDRPFSGDARVDRAALVEAIRRGRLHFSLDALAPADGFAFEVESGGRRVWMGETAPFAPGARARAGGRVPRGVRLVLRRDGVPAASGVESLDAPLPGPGVYRVEGRVEGWDVPWVVTNPVYLFGPGDAERRRAAAAWPQEAAPAEARPLAELPGSAAFTAEFDPTSAVQAGIALPEGASAQALGFGFRLGAPSPAQPFTWCALVNREARDLTGWSGLRLRILGDGEYGLWVQVRDANPASKDEGLEWWLAAARTSREWREVRIPFSRFRTINPRTDGRLDLERTRAIVFVLDFASVKVGTAGRIWIDELGVYR
jgi:hypothetical protein